MAKKLRYLICALVIVGAGLFGGVGHVVASSTLTEYPLGPSTQPADITNGPDGAMWFTEGGANKIGRITTSGDITEYDVPTPNAYPFRIVTGPDGALWFTENSGQKIGRITTSGDITEYAVSASRFGIRDITAGPDGALWFANSDKIGRITTSGVVTEFPLPTLPDTGETVISWGITAGPDGALWFGSDYPSVIGRITTSGAITIYQSVPVNSTPIYITTGSDGALWFNELNANKIGRITTSGVTTEYSTSPGSFPVSITPGPDGALWFTGINNNKIRRITTSGMVTDEYTLPGALTDLEALTFSPDGTLWFTEPNAGKIGRLSLTPPDTTPPTVIGTSTPPANTEGWDNTDVTVNWTATDSESSATTPSPTVVSTEGANQVVTSEPSCDPSNNCATGSVTLNIDKTFPVLNTPTWSNNPKSTTGSSTLIVSATDNLSGVQKAEYFIGDTDPGQGNGTTMQLSNIQNNGLSSDLITTLGSNLATGVYKISVRAQDVAGNWSLPVSDYLVVYDVNGPKMTGKHNVVPTLTNGDVLPGLIANAQTDKATFGFSIKYNNQGQINANSDLQFNYSTGTKCNNPTKAINCHNLSLNATNIDWLTTQGTNNSTGIFQGTATMVVDGVTSTIIFRVTGVDGTRLSPTANDRFQIMIFPQGANPNTDAPLYRVNSADILRGNIKIV